MFWNRFAITYADYVSISFNTRSKDSYEGMFVFWRRKWSIFDRGDTKGCLLEMVHEEEVDFNVHVYFKTCTRTTLCRCDVTSRRCIRWKWNRFSPRNVLRLADTQDLELYGCILHVFRSVWERPTPMQNVLTFVNEHANNVERRDEKF
jgi:hypothetical protein